MAQKSDNQKIKLLKIVEMLSHEADEEHPLSTAEMIERLDSFGISCDRRTLYKDMEYLKEWGYNVLQSKKGHNNAYCIAQDDFDDNELRIIIDALGACAFLTREQTAELTGRIASLSPARSQQIIDENIVSFNPYKHTNKGVYYVVNEIRQALRTGKKISFTMIDVDHKGRISPHRDGKEYVVEPVSLLFRDDNYYLIALNHNKEINCRFVHFRVDRIKSVEVLDEDIGSALQKKVVQTELRKHVNSAFSMFAGKQCYATLTFGGSLLNPVHDKFGENVKIRKIGEDLYAVTAYVQASPTFFGWVAQFGGNMNIARPEWLRQAYIEHISKTLDAAQTPVPGEEE